MADGGRCGVRHEPRGLWMSGALGCGGGGLGAATAPSGLALEESCSAIPGLADTQVTQGPAESDPDVRAVPG